jgi:hypothetical protein
MTTEEMIIHVFCIVDDQMVGIMKHPQAKLYPSELVTIGILFALKGGTFSGFYRWLKRDYDGLFGGLPDRTRLQRALAAHEDWTNRFLSVPSFFTVADSYPIELIFPIREGRSPHQVGKKGRDKGRWTIGGRFWALLDNHGRFIEWYFLPLNHADNAFNGLTRDLAEQTVTLVDQGFREADGTPDPLKICQKGTWNERMVVEGVFAMLTWICHLKKFFHRARAYIFMHLSFVVAMFNVLYTLFHQLHPEENEFKLSIAEFSL